MYKQSSRLEVKTRRSCMCCV